MIAGTVTDNGVPIITLNDVPLRGFNSVLKRATDVIISGAALAVMAITFYVVLLLAGAFGQGNPGDEALLHARPVGAEAIALLIRKEANV